jgi:hypothetical protein
MVQNWFLVQVANEMLSHMADDIRYLGQTTFRGSRNYEVPCEDDFLVVYSGFNSGSLFPLFVTKVSKVLIIDQNEFICIINNVSKVVKVREEFAEYELRYFPQCKTNMIEHIDSTLLQKLWQELQVAPALKAWN